MKSLLRKKTHADIQKPSPPSSTPSSIRQQPPTIATPLYARFASAKSGGQLEEKLRPNVSGPMRLGRPIRANSEAEDNHRKREEAALPRPKPSNGRQGIAPAPQPPPSSLPGPRDGQSFVDAPYQSARVNLTQAARQPVKAQTCKSCFPSLIMCSSTLRQRAMERDMPRTSEHLSMAVVSFRGFAGCPPTLFHGSCDVDIGGYS